MKYLVMGAGALGSVFGGLLAEAGHDVTFVGADDHLKAMQGQGLTITGLWGEHAVGPVKAFYGTERLSGTFDTVLLSVKSYHTASVMTQTLPFVHGDSLVFSIQNGLGNWDAIAQAVGWHRTVGARVIFGAEVEKPGTARVTVYADKVLLGSPSGTAPQEKIQLVCDHLNKAGIPTAVSDEIASFLWGKVLYNCSLNALGAILNVPYGSLRETPEIMTVMHRVVEEIFAVAHAKGITLPYESAEAYYSILTDVQLPPTALHRSSMLQDMAKGSRLTEIDALNGAISRYGRELNVPTPVNDVLTAVIKGIQAKSA
ncbi:MAG TPA: ketopantoate reductase family protein [Deltaproteobacteria bacterium]|nr:ketopantoate reductase family protein [Deltaproteobacteria bacterium]HPR53909.1 ketopantoate reductase family protein [Deltaproteobacteria bacterium]HXK46709.1 ketopantoate reductase family protein [Deltaproteobacteria bacterium]